MASNTNSRFSGPDRLTKLQKLEDNRDDDDEFTELDFALGNFELALMDHLDDALKRHRQLTNFCGEPNSLASEAIILTVKNAMNDLVFHVRDKAARHELIAGVINRQCNSFVDELVSGQITEFMSTSSNENENLRRLLSIKAYSQSFNILYYDIVQTTELKFLGDAKYLANTETMLASPSISTRVQMALLQVANDMNTPWKRRWLWINEGIGCFLSGMATDDKRHFLRVFFLNWSKGPHSMQYLAIKRNDTPWIKEMLRFVVADNEVCSSIVLCHGNGLKPNATLAEFTLLLCQAASEEVDLLAQVMANSGLRQLLRNQSFRFLAKRLVEYGQVLKQRMASSESVSGEVRRDWEMSPMSSTTALAPLVWFTDVNNVASVSAAIATLNQLLKNEVDDYRKQRVLAAPRISFCVSIYRRASYPQSLAQRIPREMIERIFEYVGKGSDETLSGSQRGLDRRSSFQRPRQLYPLGSIGASMSESFEHLGVRPDFNEILRERQLWLNSISMSIPADRMMMPAID